MTANFNRRVLIRSAVLAGAAVTAGTSALAGSNSASAACRNVRRGSLFTSTNSNGGNAVQIFDRTDDGPVALINSVPTGGLGSGAGLASQGSVMLSGDGRYLFVVNAGSSTLSTFRVGADGLHLTSTVDSGGPSPSSVTEYEGLVYVMNSGQAGFGVGSSVMGYRNRGGVLQPINGSNRALRLTSNAPVLGQIGFGLDGDVLIVTDRNNTVYSWPVLRDGSLGPRTATPSPGGVPFGFAFNKRDILVISEAGGTATSGGSTLSSYRISERAMVPAPITLAAPTTQGAACWIAITPDGRYAFSANAGSSSVSSFAIGRNGSLTLKAGVAASMGNAGALDLAASPDGKQLHVFASRSLEIFTYSIDEGVLTFLGTSAGPVAGGAGMAAN